MDESVKRILYTAAHGGARLDRAPLGGGGAVCEQLAEEWGRTRPFPFERITPSILGAQAPREEELVRLSEWAYARFCRAFERASTQAILKCDPARVVVLCNDVAEGPDFDLLAGRGYPIYTIYHVDVVDYFTRIYWRGRIRPETAARLYRWIERTPLRIPFDRLLGLVFQKQQSSARASQGLIVPSQRMREVLSRCYPLEANKIHVIPWGIWDEPSDAAAVENETARLRADYRIPEGTAVLLTLSRISPEKGQDRILRALALWERRPDFPSEGVVLFIAGEAAYMQGERFRRKLERLSGKLRRTRVLFPGYARGALKQALFRLADLYLFASRHESYGLTLMEAMKAGLPVLSADSHGAREIFQEGTGEMLPPAPETDVPDLLSAGLRRLLADRTRLKQMGEAAKRHAEGRKFSEAAARLAELLTVRQSG